MLSNATSIRLLLLADDPLVRGGLHALAAGDDHLSVVAQVGTGEAAAALADFAPDVLLWDAGAEPAQTLAKFPRRDEATPPSVVLLPDERHVPAALAAGARGVLSRDVQPRRLAAAVDAVLQGLFVADELFDPEAAATPRPARGASSEDLTAREREVLPLLAEGLSNKLIAARLAISEHTAKFHVTSVMQKLGAQTRTDAVVKAARQGLLVL